MTETIEDGVREVMASVLRIPVADIGVDTTMERIEAWDSMKHIELMSMLEDRFGITLETDSMIEMIDFESICRNMAVSD